MKGLQLIFLVPINLSNSDLGAFSSCRGRPDLFPRLEIIGNSSHCLPQSGLIYSTQYSSAPISRMMYVLATNGWPFCRFFRSVCCSYRTAKPSQFITPLFCGIAILGLPHSTTCTTTFTLTEIQPSLSQLSRGRPSQFFLKAPCHIVWILETEFHYLRLVIVVRSFLSFIKFKTAFISGEVLRSKFSCSQNQ